jgi:hypothetical protein
MNRAHPQYLGLLLVLILSACSASTPTPVFEATPTATLTPFVLPPEFTPTMTETPTQSPAEPADSAETPVVAAPSDSSNAPAVDAPADSAPAPAGGTTATASSPAKASGPVCNNALYIDDVTIPDGTVVAPGKKFVKTWKIKNFGACRWSTSYAIGFAYGSPLAGVETKLTVAVDPGQTVDVSVILTAPTDNGWYGSWWRMKTDTGVNFGDFVFASIQVTEGKAIPTPTPIPTP